jgi:hypothetical protein
MAELGPPLTLQQVLCALRQEQPSRGTSTQWMERPAMCMSQTLEITCSGGEEDGGSGPGTLERLDAPRGVTMTAGDARIYVADAARCRMCALAAVFVATRSALCSDIAAALLLAPPGCTQALPPRDALHRMASPFAGGGMQHLQRSVRAGLSNDTAAVWDGAVWMELDSRRLVPPCLGDAPPDIGMSSSGAWLSVTGGTNI